MTVSDSSSRPFPDESGTPAGRTTPEPTTDDQSDLTRGNTSRVDVRPTVHESATTVRAEAAPGGPLSKDEPTAHAKCSGLTEANGLTEATLEIPSEFTGTRQADGIGDPSSPLKARRGHSRRPSALATVLPKRIGRFRIVSELGRGGNGVVYLAHDDQLERDVAIKVSLVADADYQERLRVEASKVAKVEGPGIVPVYHIGKTDFGAVYIVQKYIEGMSLRKHLATRNEISVGRAILLARDIALGLAPAHDRDILHRDLKPDNILLDRTGNVWIADFGLAISQTEQRGHRRELAGTPLYMSPEQTNGRVDLMDGRSDIWAIGVMYYELLTGKHPFMAKNKTELAKSVCRAKAQALSEIDPERLTPEMDEVFLSCCAKEPDDRFASIDDLVEALSELASRHATAADLVGWPGDDGGALERSARRRFARLTTRVRGNSSGTLAASTPRRSSVTSVSEGGATTLPTIASSRKRAAAKSIAVATAGCVAIGWLLFRDGRGPATPMMGNVARATVANSSDVDKLIDDQADGSTERPWRVATTGTASHRDLQTAIDQAEAGDLIEIAKGRYEGAVTIRKAIRIRGADPANPPVLVCDAQSPLTVDCGDQEVELADIQILGRGFRYDRSGNQVPSPFNAVSLRRGTLRIRHGKLRRESSSLFPEDDYNAIKVFTDATLIATDCHFFESPGFAISTKDHHRVTVEGCRFQSGGVQLVGGVGAIHDCDFHGVEGILVSDTPDSAVRVTNCRFMGIPHTARADNRGLAISAGGKVISRGNTFRNLYMGIRIGTERDVVNPSGATNRLSSHGDTLEDCVTAVSVQGGDVKLTDHTSVRGGRFGVNLALGSVHLRDVRIEGCEQSGIHANLESDHLAIHDVRVSDCGVEGVSVAHGELEIDGLQISGADTSGLMLGGTVDATSLRRLTVADCRYGLFVNPDEDHAIRLRLTGCRFENCDRLAIHLRGDTSLWPGDTDFANHAADQRMHAARPATIAK